ncbi:MAG: FISUMP domain-containing protein [Bacteroidales bacterium]
MKKNIGLFLLVFAILMVGCGKKSASTSNALSGTFKDSRDNQEYTWVRIGEQVWMSVNLAYLPSVSQPDEKTYTPGYFVYGYNGTNVNEAKANANYNTYGVLYNWDAAKEACPKGWHLPSDVEWQKLESHLGMISSEIDQDFKWRQSGKLGIKLKSDSGWQDNGNGVDSLGFKALPAGFRYDTGGFDNLGSYTIFWSASEGGVLSAWNRAFLNANQGMFRCADNKRYGFSVRCIRD